MNLWNQDILSNLSGIEKKQFLAKRRIIKQLYRKGSMSINELCKELLLSKPTAIHYMNDLISEGYIEEKGLGESIGGRRPMYYDLNPNSFYILGVDIERKSIKISLFSMKLQCVNQWDEKPFDLVNGADMVNTLVQYIKDFTQELTIKPSQIIGIGLIMPGLIDSDKGINYTFLTQECENLSETLTEKLDCPVYIENDAKGRALAELHHGAGQGLKDVLVIFVGLGLGLGMILNGKLHLGKSGFAGEFSHIPIENNTHFCNCGKTGCLETIASGEALVRMAKEQLQNGAQSVLSEKLLQQNNLTPELIVDTALNGDYLCISLLNEIGINLGKGIAYLVQILNPEKIVLGGKVAKAGDFLTNAISQTLFQYCLPKLKEDVAVEVSKLGTDAGVIGAATLVIEKVLSH